MKKILLASTILVGTAGFAAADSANFSFSGEAYVGMAYVFSMDETIANFDWDGDGIGPEANVAYLTPEVSAEFTAAMSTMTDGGLEAGASITISAAGISVDDDHTSGTFGEASFDTAGSISDAEAYLSGDWGKLAVAYDNNGTSDTTGNTEPDVTFTYSNSWGDFDVEAYYTWAGNLNDGGVPPSGVGLSNGDMGLKGTYNFGDYSVFAAIDWDASDALGAGDWNATIGGSASMSGFSLSAEANYNNFANDWDWMAEASYSTGPYSVGAFVEEDDGANTGLDFGANASYDLGGGVSLDAAYVFDQDYDAAGAADGVSLVKLGVSMAF